MRTLDEPLPSYVSLPQEVNPSAKRPSIHPESESVRPMRRSSPVSLTALACFAVFALTGLFAFDAQQRASTTVHKDTERSARPQRVVIEFPFSPATAPTERTVVDASAIAQLVAVFGQLDNPLSLAVLEEGYRELVVVEIEALYEQLPDLSTDVSLLGFTLDDLPAKIER